MEANGRSKYRKLEASTFFRETASILVEASTMSMKNFHVCPYLYSWQSPSTFQMLEIKRSMLEIVLTVLLGSWK